MAEANTALSVANWREAIRVPQALGLDPWAAGLASQLASKGVILPCHSPFHPPPLSGSSP